MSAEIPPTFLDLINAPRVAALTTLMPDGQPQTTVVWCDFDGTFVRVNTMRGFRKEKNMRMQMSGKSYSLPQRLSADGGRYAKSGVSFWVKGQQATLKRPKSVSKATVRVGVRGSASITCCCLR